MGYYSNEKIVNSIDLDSLLANKRHSKLEITKVTLLWAYSDDDSEIEFELSLEKKDGYILLNKGTTGNLVEEKLDDKKSYLLFDLLADEIIDASLIKKENCSTQTNGGLVEIAIAKCELMEIKTENHMITATMIAIFKALTEIDKVWSSVDVGRDDSTCIESNEEKNDADLPF